ncbi:MAG: undecaprenyl-phosphate glucose phosphotransferase [Parvularculaceae bacterium]|nr:undecaprenyl-phosphate glucose phosphotransferase [Parvularculaceae bacterium]
MLESDLSDPGPAQALTRKRSPLARTILGDVVQFVDFVAVTAASILVAAIYHQAVIDTEFDVQIYAAAGLVGATGVTAILRRDGFYDFERLVSTRWMARGVLARISLVMLGLIAFGFALKISESYSRFWLFAWSIVSALLLLLSRLVAGSVLRRTTTADGAFARRIAVIGKTAAAEKFKELAERGDYAATVVGIYDVNFKDAATTRAFDLTGNLAAVARAARAGEIDDIVVAVPDADPADMKALLRRLSILPVAVALAPSPHWLDHTGGSVVQIGGASILNLYRRPLEGWGGVIKTAEDRLLGAIALVIASPVLLVIAALIKLQDGGPVFFRQRRHGFNHEVFNIYKFRTMTVAEDGDEVKQAVRNDPRITPIGAFLRRYSLDELPQLINVLKGEMSLVGPRPHALAHNHAYAQAIENYSGRHKMKPGLTGWAQVNGYRGETSENELMAERVKYDLDYIDNWSLWFDLKIMALTVAAVLFPKNAY